MPEEDEDEYLQENSLSDSNGSANLNKIKWTPDSVNSHLHHSKSAPLDNMADLRLSGGKR
jgi:hypothetical protein